MDFHWRTDDFGMSAWPWPVLLFLTRQIACFMYHDFQQCSGLSHTSFQELSGDIGSCLAPQIGRFVEFSAWH